MKPMTFLTAAALLMASFTAANATPHPLTKHWTLTGFDQPESVLYDTDHDRLIVSNILGHPLKADGEGYLSLISVDGKVIEKYWVEGLDAPKGMGIANGLLYVADLTKIRVIDLETGEKRQDLTAPNVILFNDIATSDRGEVFVGEFIKNQIFQISGETLKELPLPGLTHPNGLYVEGDTLYVANWGGPDVREDWSTDVPGDFRRYSLTNHQELMPRLVAPIGNLDGIAKLSDRWVISDYLSGDLLITSKGGTPIAKHQIGSGLADITTAKDMIFAPMMWDGTVSGYRLK